MALAIALAERTRGPGAAGRTLAAWGRVVGGAALPVLALLLGLALHGGRRAIEGFAEHVVAWTLVFADFTKEGPVTDEGLGFLALAAAGVALVVRSHGRATLAHPLHGPLLCSAGATAIVLLLPTTPAVYRHAWLPVVAVAGVYAGHALAAALAATRTRRLAAFALAAVAVAAGLLGPASVSLATALADGNSRQFRLMRLELAHTCPGEAVLDGTALYVFRPAAHRYRVLIVGVREWIATGVVSEDLLVDDVRASRPRVAYIDSRLRGLVGSMAEFLARHYVRSADGLLIAGAAVRLAPPREAGRAYVELLHGETYRLAASPGVGGRDRPPAGAPRAGPPHGRPPRGHLARPGRRHRADDAHLRGARVVALNPPCYREVEAAPTCDSGPAAPRLSPRRPGTSCSRWKRSCARRWTTSSPSSSASSGAARSPSAAASASRRPPRWGCCESGSPRTATRRS